jgi:hypothetical protein
MPPVRVCSECGDPISGRSVTSKTCSSRCRNKRSRRIRRENRDAQQFIEQHHDGAQEIRAIVRHEAPDEIKKVMNEELRPIVRESLTEDVLRAISDMIGLTPRAVAALSRDLESEDPLMRQRAYSLCIKYTIGHPALLQRDDTDAGKQLTVNFGLPRPDEQPEQQADAEAEAEELALCDMCQAMKPVSEMVAGSTRCQECFEDWKANIIEQFTS